MLLMDEPLSNLDALLRLEMRTELKAVLREAGTTTIYVTHDQTEAMGLADRIAVMYGGKIDQIGSPLEIYATPATRFVGGFIGSPPMNFIKVRCSGGAATIGDCQTRVSARQAAEMELGLRGEDASLSPGQIGHSLRCARGRAHGLPPAPHRLHRRTARPHRRAAHGRRSNAGERVGLRVDPSRVTWIDGATGRAVARA